MAHPSSSAPLFELWEPEVGTYGKLPLRLKPGTKTGYQGVHKVKKKTFQARRVTSGKLRHVYTHDVDGPRYCAYILVAADAGFDLCGRRLPHQFEEEERHGKPAADELFAACR